MEPCPHCSFLVPDGAATCGVCHRSVDPSTAQAPTRAAVVPARSSGTPSVAIVALLLLIVVFGAGAGLAAAAWG